MFSGMLLGDFKKVCFERSILLHIAGVEGVEEIPTTGTTWDGLTVQLVRWNKNKNILEVLAK